MSLKHFHEQKEFAREHVIPYLKDMLPLHNVTALEVGCAEGGLINEMTNSNIFVMGLEISKQRAETAEHFNKHEVIFQGDITDKELSVDLIDRCYDLAIMIDTIEHISDKDSALKNIKQLLRYNGYLYITFPTKQSPFAGHQQNLKTWLRYIPYLSYFPEKVIRFAGKLAKEKDSKISEIIKNKYNAVDETLFEQKCLNMGFKIIDKNRYLSRPSFKLRYNLPVIKAINHITTFGCEYLLKYSPITT